MILVVFERHALVGCFSDVIFGCFGGVMFGCTLVGAMVGWGGIICIIVAIVRCGGGI